MFPSNFSIDINLRCLLCIYICSYYIEFEDHLESSKEFDYSSVIEKLETIQAPLSYSWSVVNHLMVSNVVDSTDVFLLCVHHIQIIIYIVEHIKLLLENIVKNNVHNIVFVSLSLVHPYNPVV